jgi:hypothetical protein
MLDYFEPTETWSQVQLPENQLLFGSFGSGKSSLLRRLQASAMARRPLFDQASPFLGIYVNLLLDVEFTDDLYSLSASDLIQARWPDARVRASTVIERFLGLTLMQATLDEIIAAARSPFFGKIRREKELVTTLAGLYDLQPSGPSSAQELRDQVRGARNGLIAASASVKIFDHPTADPMARVQLPMVAQAIAAVAGEGGLFAQYGETLPIYFLIDQLESVSPLVQGLLTPLLRRGTPYVTKMATRLYGFRPEREIRVKSTVDDDVYPLFVGYTDSQADEFRRVASAVANKMLSSVGAGLTVASLLGANETYSTTATDIYSGLDAFYALSSGSVRLFLELCSHVVICAEARGISWMFDTVPADCQGYAARIWAKRSLERIETSHRELGPTVRSLVENLCRESRRDQGRLPLSFSVASDLLGLDLLTGKSQRAIRAAFEFDAFTFVDDRDASLFDIPERFAITNIVTAAFGLPLERGNEKIVRSDEFAKNLSTGRNPEKESDHERRPTLFLSTSFAETPTATAQRQQLNDVLASDFEVILGDNSPGGGALLAKVARGIRAASVVVVEASTITPSVMLELGFAYALRRRVFVLYNSASPTSELQDYVRSLELIGYTFDREQLKSVRDRIVQRSRDELQPQQGLEVNLHGVSLRPKPASKGIFVYGPASSQIWQTTMPQIETALQKAGRFLITLDAAPSNSLLLEQIMFCVNRAGRVETTSCIIDTSAEVEPDLPGSFALGVAAALQRNALRVEEIDRAHRDRLSLWTEPYFPWSNTATLEKEILKHLKDKRPSLPKKRRRK